MRKELWCGLIPLAIILVGTAIILPAPGDMTRGHLGLLMLALVVVTIIMRIRGIHVPNKDILITQAVGRQVEIKKETYHELEFNMDFP